MADGGGLDSGLPVGVEEEVGGLVLAEAADELDGSSLARGGDGLVAAFAAEELVDSGGEDAGAWSGELADAVHGVEDATREDPGVLRHKAGRYPRGTGGRGVPYSVTA